MIVAENLTIAAGAFRLPGITFRIPPGAYCGLMGRTGCGKTTLLETICGLKQLAAGKIFLDGHDATELPPSARNIGLVPQDAALFNAMTVRAHLAFALRIRKWRPADIARRVDQLATLLEIEDLLDRRPLGLSGGEKHRVALGRAMSFLPRILCLDEPLSSLDDETRQHLVALLQRVRAETGVTTLHITHNRAEADALADTWLFIRDGQVVQVPNGQTDGDL